MAMTVAAQAAPAPDPPVLAPVAAPPPAGTAEALMHGHRQLMSRFLETHKNVMMAAMQGVPAPAAVQAVSQPVAQPAAPPVPQPVAAPPPPVVVPAAAPEPEPIAIAAAAAATTTSAEPARLTRADISARLVDLVSQRTGYPAEMLGLELDMEADLGIDSIKRIEIFGASAKRLHSRCRDHGGRDRKSIQAEDSRRHRGLDCRAHRTAGSNPPEGDRSSPGGRPGACPSPSPNNMNNTNTEFRDSWSASSTHRPFSPAQ